MIEESLQTVSGVSAFDSVCLKWPGILRPNSSPRMHGDRLFGIRRSAKASGGGTRCGHRKPPEKMRVARENCAGRGPGRSPCLGGVRPSHRAARTVLRIDGRALIATASLCLRRAGRRSARATASPAPTDKAFDRPGASGTRAPAEMRAEGRADLCDEAEARRRPRRPAGHGPAGNSPDLCAGDDLAGHLRIGDANGAQRDDRLRASSITRARGSSPRT